MSIGPNHRDGCDGNDFRYSGEGYNRVRVCACGAEDHAPTAECDCGGMPTLNRTMDLFTLRCDSCARSVSVSPPRGKLGGGETLVKLLAAWGRNKNTATQESVSLVRDAEGAGENAYKKAPAPPLTDTRRHAKRHGRKA